MNESHQNPASRGLGPVRRVAQAALAALLLATGIAAHAQADDELPTRVGRIAEFSGDIFLAPGDRADEWIPVGLNYPVTSGDNLWVGGEGRAEVDFGGGQFRLGGDTNLNVSRLDERQLALYIAQGRLIVRVRVLGVGDSVGVDTPNAQIRLMRQGLYRIDVPADRGVTTVSVREGEAEVAYTGGVARVLPGQSVVLAGADPDDADVRNAAARDAFDAWSGNRDRYYEGGTAAEYVPPEMVGYAELDHYGSWETYPEYGNVWFPTGVAPGWAPYSDGYWANVGGWGSTWVDAAPWGYAPSHYGRWVWFGQRWGWCPGRGRARPAWSPALVAWYGGAGWGAALGTRGSVYGWVPLGWREAFHPWWRGCGERCWTRYNRPYAVTVPYAQRRMGTPPIYANAAVPGAISAVSGATLAERKPVAPNRIALPPRAGNSAPLLAEAPPVRAGPGQSIASRPVPRTMPAPASTLRPSGQIGRGTREAGVLPTRVQTPPPAPPSEARGRPGVSNGIAPPAPSSGSVAPASPGRSATVPVPAQVQPRDANGNAAATRPDARASPRSEPLRSVPVPPSSGAAMPVPATRAEPMRSVPVPQPAPAPNAGSAATLRSPPVQAIPNRGEAPPHAAPASPAPAQVAPQGQAAAPLPARGESRPPVQHPAAKDAPAAPATGTAPVAPAPQK